MSATHITLTFIAVVADSDHWSTEHRQACEASDSPASFDWVEQQLHEVMAEAGDRFIASHPDLFRTDQLV